MLTPKTEKSKYLFELVQNSLDINKQVTSQKDPLRDP